MNEGIPIRLLSELTGVAATTLRAWEKRYQLLTPRRTTKGHRLYSQQDVALVKEIVAKLQAGISISDESRIFLGKGQHQRYLGGVGARTF